MATGTNVTYNGVVLTNVTTRSWDMEAVYDEDDTLSYYRLKMSFETIFLPYHEGDPVDALGVTRGNAASAPDTWNFNKKRLLAPRKHLIITMNGVTALDVIPIGNITGDAPVSIDGKDVDCLNGPRPTSLEFDNVLGSTSIRATYHIEACLSPCETKVPYVLANRWTISETMDEDFFVTKTFVGYLRKNSSKHPSSNYRGWMWPPLEDGFKRTNVTFDEHADHLGIDWRVTDRQVHLAPPWPCTKLEGSQTETTGNGITWHSEVRVRASGSPESRKRDMFAQCARIIELRIGYKPEDAVGAKNGGKFLVRGCTMVDHFGSKNQVEMVMRIEHNWGANEAKKDKFKTFLTNLRGRIADPAYYDLAKHPGASSLKEPEPYNKMKSRRPYVWGHVPHGNKRSARICGMWEHYLTDLCQAPDYPKGDSYSPDAYGSSPDSESGKDTESLTTVDYDDSLSKDSHMYDPVEQGSLYTLARVEDEYSYDPRVAVLPVMTQDNSGGNAGASGLSSYVVNIGRPCVYRVLTVEYERIGEWPAIPELKTIYTDPLNRNLFQLVNHRVVAKPPAPGQDGKQIIYSAWAQYTYVCKSNLYSKTLADWDWSLVSLPLTTVTHHIEHDKLWRDVNGGKLNSGRGNMSSTG
jgi:hypothetical protein